MRIREQIAAFVLIAGVSLLVVGVFLALPHRSDRWRSREAIQARRELGNNIVKVGAVITVLGVGVLAVVYLTRRVGFERSYSGATIIACFVANRQGEVILHPSGYLPSELRYYVRLRFPNGESDEFECPPALYTRIHDGMVGRAVCKGNQLLAFYPLNPTQTARPPAP